MNFLKKKTLYYKFLGHLIKKGNKNIAKNILDNSLFLTYRKLNYSYYLLLLKIFKKLNFFVEARKIKHRRRTFLVPFSIKLNRRIYLVVKWILDSSYENKNRIPLFKKISSELISILIKKDSKSKLKKEINIKNIIKNRANAHYRW